MNRILIVSKTHMGQYLCVGALCRETHRSLRLFRADGGKLTEADGYDIGQVWLADFAPAPTLDPPHVEDVWMLRREADRTLTPAETRAAILRHAQPVTGPIDALFDGGLHWPPGTDRSAYLTRQHIPEHSTAFWQPDRPQVFFGGAKGEPYYRYLHGDHSLKIKFVGFQKPKMTLPAGALLRMSLARWERFEGMTEDRCYLQLSGWWV